MLIYDERWARVDGLIPHRPIEQAIFLMSVRSSYASGMSIAEAITAGVQVTVERYPGFVVRYDPELNDLPD
ncbi:MAG: hypothetical protein ABIQ73_23605 [Acidimicrobiales bacterium]